MPIHGERPGMGGLSSLFWGKGLVIGGCVFLRVEGVTTPPKEGGGKHMHKMQGVLEEMPAYIWRKSVSFFSFLEALHGPLCTRRQMLDHAACWLEAGGIRVTR